MTGERKLFGTVLGLLGNFMIGLSLFKLIQTGSCGGLYPPCPSSVVPFIVMMPAGIIISMVGIFAGGGALIFTGVFLSVGLGSLAAGIFGEGPAEMKTFAYVFGGIFTVVSLALVVAGLGAGRLMRSKAVKAQSLVATGARGIGTGNTFPVRYDRDDPSSWAYGTDMDSTAAPEVQQLFARAAQAAAEPVDSLAEELTKLNDLRMKGVLTDAEFETAKNRLLT